MFESNTMTMPLLFNCGYKKSHNPFLLMQTRMLMDFILLLLLFDFAFQKLFLLTKAAVYFFLPLRYPPPQFWNFSKATHPNWPFPKK